MGTYSAEEFLETFGGLPEPGECIPDFDAIRDRARDSYGYAPRVPTWGRPFESDPTITNQED